MGKYKNPFCIGALCIIGLALIYFIGIKAVNLYGEDCSQMVKANNTLIKAEAFDRRNELKEELMNLRHRSQIPTQFNKMSKHEYRYFLRGQIYAHACFLDMVESQELQTLFGD